MHNELSKTNKTLCTVASETRCTIDVEVELSSILFSVTEFS